MNNKGLMILYSDRIQSKSIVNSILLATSSLVSKCTIFDFPAQMAKMMI